MRSALCLVTFALAFYGASALAGAYTFTEGILFSQERPDLVVHPAGYNPNSGTPSTFDVNVCITPGSPFQNQMVIPLQNVIDRFNLLVPANPNLRITTIAPNFPKVDWESVAVHEIGHCVGLNHVNAASEGRAAFGISLAEAESTKARPGANNDLDPDSGADGLFGSPDDPRSDDDNLHYFEPDVNNPFALPDVVDSSSYSRSAADLPLGDNFAANGDRTVAFDVYGVGDAGCASFTGGARCAEAVMQQGSFNAELQRPLGVDDVATLMYARTGVDRVVNTSDDYVPTLVYFGISSSSECDINVAFDDTETGFAVCQSSVNSGNLNSSQDAIALSSGVNNFYNTNSDWRFTSFRIPLPGPDEAVVAPSGTVSMVNGSETSLLANDLNQNTQQMGSGLTLTSMSFGGPASGTVVLNSNGTFSYTNTDPAATSDRFVYEVCFTGDEEICAHQWVNVSIVETNAQPEPQPDDVLLAEGGVATMTSVGGTLLDNDSDPDMDTLTVATEPAMAPGIGALVLFSDGSFSYQHDGTETISDSFVYTVCDDETPPLCANATVSIVVSEVNDPVVALDDALPTANQGAGDVTIDTADLLANDSAGEGEDGQTLTVTDADNPSGGTVALNGNDVVFSPDPEFAGTASFDYEASDDGTTDGVPAFESDTASVTFRINDRPTTVADQATTAQSTTVVIPVLDNDSDADGLDASTVMIVMDPASGAAIVDAGDGTIAYTPDTDFFGDDAFAYVVTDLLGAVSNDTAVSVEVNDPPLAEDDSALLRREMTSDIDVLGNDSDDADAIDASSVQVESAPSFGMVEVATNGTIDYTPDSGFFGADSFTYSVADSRGARSQPGTVNLTVDDPPLATDDSVVTNQDAEVLVDVLVNDVDAEGMLDTGSIVVTIEPARGSAEVLPAGAGVRYAPDAGFFGADAFSYTVEDTLDQVSEPAQVSVSINGQPQAADDQAMTRRELAVDIDVLGNDTDPDGALNAGSIVVSGGPANGTAEVLPGGEIRYTPAIGFVGDDAFDYSVADDLGFFSQLATVSISVIGNPIAVDDLVVTDPNVPLVIRVLDNDSDDGALVPGSVTIVQPPVNGVAVVNPVDGTIDYAPTLDFSGLDILTYTVEDDLGLVSNEATVRVGVGQAPPVAVDDELAMGPLGSTRFTTEGADSLLDNDLDPNDDVLSVTTTPATAPTAGEVTLMSDGTFVYRHTDDAALSDRFEYEVCDPSPLCDVGTVDIIILPQTVHLDGFEAGMP